MNKPRLNINYIFFIMLINIDLPTELNFIKTNMLKTIILLSFVSLISLGANAQADSTDLLLSTTAPVLETEMDSILFGAGGYEEHLLEFDITDTASFGKVSIEFAFSNGQVLSKLDYTLSELQSANLIDSNWKINIDFGKFETGQAYKVSLIVGNYAGVLSSSISKHY